MKDNICAGCGVLIQTTDSTAPGYVPQKTVDKNLVCQRCYRIKHYGKLEGVNISEESFVSTIKTATDKADYTLLVADFFDPEGSLAPRWDLILKKPVVLIINKADLIPVKTPWHEVEKWFLNLFKKKFPGLSIIGVKAVSAIKNENLSWVLKEYKSKKLAIVGASNVGKSSLLRVLLKRNNISSEPTISYFPGTTQGLTKWYIKDSNLEMIDTPGLTSGSRMGDILQTKWVRKLIPNRELQIKLWELPTDNAVLLSNLACVINFSHNTKTTLFFTSDSLQIHRTNKRKAELLLKEAPDWLCIGEKYTDYKEETYNIQPGEDIYISGLGWLTVKKEPASFHLVVRDKVEIGVRPSLVGKKIYNNN